MKGETLCFTLKNPFDLFAKARTCEEWRRLVDSLQTSPELKSISQILWSSILNWDRNF